MFIIPDVPPFSLQARDDDCASVALASLLAHAGHPVSAERIDKAIYDETLRGALLFEMENYADRQGTTPHSGRGDLDLLHDILLTGTPLLLPIDLGVSLWRRPHYVVVFGYDQQNFLMYKRHGKPVIISAGELDRRWEKMGRLYLYLDQP